MNRGHGSALGPMNVDQPTIGPPTAATTRNAEKTDPSPRPGIESAIKTATETVIETEIGMRSRTTEIGIEGHLRPPHYRMAGAC